MATIPDAYLRRIRRDLPASAPEHLDCLRYRDISLEWEHYAPDERSPT